MATTRHSADIEIAATVKGRERFIVLFHSDARGRADAFDAICRWAEAPDLSFTLSDAGELMTRMRADWDAEDSPRDTETARQPPAAFYSPAPTSMVAAWLFWLTVGLVVWGLLR